MPVPGSRYDRSGVGNRFTFPSNIERSVMQTWLEEVNDEVLKLWLKHSPTMKLVSRLSGDIIWANPAFLEWSQYTLGELRRLTWMQISVPDKNLEADIDEAKNLDAFHPTYTVRKQYIPKGSKPEWGSLTVMRYPLTGDIEYCLCTWEPLKNGTAQAFAHAMEQTMKFEEKIEAMSAELSKLTTRTDEENWVIGSIRMVKSHPRLAMAFLVVAASIFGLNNVVELLQRTGVIQLPVKVEQQANPTAQANAITKDKAPEVYTVQLSNGKTVTWSPTNERLHRPVSYLARPSEPRGIPNRAGSSVDRRQHAPVDSVPPGQSWQWSAASTGAAVSATATGDATDF